MESTSTSPSSSDSDSSTTSDNDSMQQPIITPAPEAVEPGTPTITPPAEPSQVITPSVTTDTPTPVASTFTAPEEPAATPLAASEAPASQPNAPSPTDPVRDTGRFSRKGLLLVAVGVLLLIATGASSYLLGKHAAKPATMTVTAQQTAMAVPKDATVIEQCSPGFGTQYVLPKDIPGGPVYNVYQGKLIGIEYMTALTSASNPDLMLKDLPLFAQKYDHVDIMTMPAHAGFPSPHYQVDVMMVPTAVSSKITCDSSSAGSASSNMNTTMNSTNNSMSNSTTSNNKTSM